MQNIKNILCVTDLSQVSINAELAAMRLTQMFDARMTVLSCGQHYLHEPNKFLNDDVVQPKDNIAQSEEYKIFLEQKTLETHDHFKKISERFHVKIPENIEYKIKLENEVTATIDILEEQSSQIDLIIVGKQQSSFWERILFGSPAKEIAIESKVSTLIMPSSEEWSSWTPIGILAASALNETSEFAEDMAATFAAKANCPLLLLHVFDATTTHLDMNISHIFPIDYIPSQVQTDTIDEIKAQKTEEITKIKQNLQNKTGFMNISTQIDVGRVGDDILKLLKKDKNKNLLIIGARGESALKRFFLGSKTSSIEEACFVPLLVAQKN
ncbi:universal stress protein [Fluviispira sanaruensis]|uniref:Universal stress protein n=1 Tax=Fluviispira sanaruensis TaxID=2493639 RepID=A0A4P2VXA9_FLUSA|nr:universal stress protein [Fluviispira sanaruensis]BBH54275.1 universal stress protein [Fluviispira sanaruensis]